ncbi:Type IV pilus assembly ATPase component PilU [hydrothermal vent metagenome]|uniref:Type IV pilus assembly ATPase component PilU n=1 Tax=hydrothermal vent metagenome TaxID=652676 RepID=A0A3B0ZAW6_9ZZZZ
MSNSSSINHEPIDAWRLLKLMHYKNASDLILTTGMPACLKIHDHLHNINNKYLSNSDIQSIAQSFMSAEQLHEFHANLEANFAISHPDGGRYRVNVFQQQNNMGLVIRRIITSIPTFAQLGLPAHLKELAMGQRGLIIFVGATNSGKSSSLAAMVGHRNNNRSGHIVTIEDPIEYIHKHNKSIVTQREVGIDTLSYENALKNTLRQTPDLIMIGEVRSRETMEHAIAFSNTGHLVLTTLHATNTTQAIERIINFFPEERRAQLLLDLSSDIKAVIAQRLVPDINGKGRHVATEIMINTPFISNLILKGEYRTITDVMKRSVNAGMSTFDSSLYQLYTEGKISYDDALQYSDSPNEIRLLIKLKGKVDDKETTHSIHSMELENESDDNQNEMHPKLRT